MLSQMPTSAFFSIGDCMGAESCADLILMPLLERPDIEDDAAAAAAAVERRMTLRRSQRWEMKEKMKLKEYPPPIPLLARTENLHSHMPWVLQRTYTSDGRLILREERVRHHEYFLADRRDGRLTLQLVPLDSEVFDDLEDEPEADDNTSSLIGDNGGIDADQLQCSEGENGKREDVSDGKADDTGKSVLDDVKPSTTVDVGGGVGKCLQVYNISGGINASGGGSSCMFGVPVPAL